MEMVCWRGPVFYSRLFLMEKASDWLHTYHRSVITDHLHGTFWVQEVDCSFLSGLYQERRPNVLQKSDGYIFPDPSPSKINALSLIHFEWDCLLIQSLLFGLVLHQGVYAGPDVGPTTGYLFPSLSRQLASSSGFFTPLGVLSPSAILTWPGDCCQLPEVGSQAGTWA